jgi:hypothetical protein
MKILVIGTLYILSLFAIQQNQEHSLLKLRVLKIKELNDCYILTAIKKKSLDTLYLISIKDTLGQSRRCKKILTGKEYLFVVKNRSKSLSIPDDNFRLRVKNTVVWKGNEDFKKYPLMLENTKGLYIIKDNMK